MAKELAYKHDWGPLWKTTCHGHCHVCHHTVGLLTDPTLKRLLSKAFRVGVRFLWTGMCFMVFSTWKHYLSICVGLSQHAELGNKAEFLETFRQCIKHTETYQ